MSLSVPIALEFINVSQEFWAPDRSRLIRVLDRISFSVPKGRFTSIVGPSGCGKSTLLHLAAGLLSPSIGEVRQHGQAVNGLNPRVGFVPQQAQLFPWKTLEENVEMPLVFRGVSTNERRQRVETILHAVGLAGFEQHYPHQLSGGMQKRASIARTLVYNPDVVLMDEPFGALDAQTRMIMQRDLQNLWIAQRATILFVTHDLTEAALLSDNVILLSKQPTSMKADVAMQMPRPRNIFEPHKTEGFTEAYAQLWSNFQTEIAQPVGGLKGISASP